MKKKPYLEKKCIALIESVHLASRKEIEFTQTQNLRQLLKTLQEIPYYSSLDIFSKKITDYPFLTSRILAELCPPNSKKLAPQYSSGLVLRSGGSSGETKTIFHSWAGFRKVVALGSRGLVANNKTHIHKIANCLSSGNLWGGFIFAQGIAEFIDAQVYPFGGSAEPIEILTSISSHEIDTVFGIPSLLSLSLGSKNAMHLPFLRNIFYVGESFHPQQINRIKEKNPQVNIRSLAYSTNETGPIGYQCSYQSGSYHHVHEDAVLVELIDEDEKIISKSDTIGELVVTPLGINSMPLVRYRLGDLGRFIDEACGCGSKTRIIELCGRVDATVKIFGSLVSQKQILFLLNQEIDVSLDDVQLILTRDDSEKHNPILLFIIDDKLSKKILQDVIVKKLTHDSTLENIKKEVPGLKIALEFRKKNDFFRAASGKQPFYMEKLS